MRCLPMPSRILMIALVCWLSFSPCAAQDDDQIIHVVQAGENLYRISLRYGVSMDAVMAASGLTDAHRINVGQELVIPLQTDSSPTVEDPTAAAQDQVYTVQRGDTLTSVALLHRVPIWTLVQINNLSNPHVIYVGQELIIPDILTGTEVADDQKEDGGEEKPPTEATGTYVVRAGDTLYRIAQNHGTTVAALAYLNGITNPSSIHAGQILRIAGGAPTSSGGSKQIIVDLSEQHLYAYQEEQLLFSFVASSGAAPSYTRVGEFHVQSKIPNAYGAAWNIWMPHWLGIYWAGSSENGIHALPILSNGQTLWAGYLGTPISYGCIVLDTYEAKLLYDWAEIGTPVSIQP